MKSKILLLGAVGLSAGLVAACHDDNTTTVPPAPTVQELDTAAVLMLARQTSETNSPIAVNGGAVVISGTTEAAAPYIFDAM